MEVESNIEGIKLSRGCNRVKGRRLRVLRELDYKVDVLYLL